MKIRMTENSIRLRLGRSELSRFLENGRIEEVVRFAAKPEARFTYALEAGAPNSAPVTVRFIPGKLAVVVAPEQVHVWQRDDQVGIYADADTGTGNALEVVVEKDFACLDGSDRDNSDTFANPTVAASCPVG